jgi:hypothetical protein
MACTEVEVNKKKEKVRIFEMKVTPSMKNVVYGVYIIFDSSGTYLPKLSKCDCPNGWLFCSHTLACFLIIYLVQKETDWTLKDVIQFMPVPIKSLQSVPLAASYVFGELKISKPGSKLGKKKKDDAYTRKIAKSIADDIPGYSGKYTIDEADADEETRIMNEDLVGNDGRKDVKNIDLCGRIDQKLEKAANERSASTKNDTKVTMASITEFNQKLVTKKVGNKTELRQLLRHERLYQMMESGAISKDNTLWYYLHHFKADRARQIVELEELVAEDKRLAGAKSVDYDSAYLKDYFADADDDKDNDDS